MRRTVSWLLQATAGLVFVACGTDSVKVGTRSDGVTVVCNDGEYYYTCTPEAPNGGTNLPGDDGSGSGGSDSGSGTSTDPGGDGSGSGSGSGSGATDPGGDGSGSGSGSGDCNFDSGYDCGGGGGSGSGSDGGGSGSGGDGGGDGGGDQCVPWPAGPANVLWPPNHKLLTFTLDDCANLSVCPQGQTAAIDGHITQITVDEAVDVGKGGDGHTTNYDVAILDAQTFQLRSERQGGADGRVYTVYYEDAAGNQGSCQYLVPHNQGPFEGAVDSGTVVTVTP